MTKRERYFQKVVKYMKENREIRSPRAYLVRLNYGDLKMLMFREKNVYNFYLADENTPYKYMFGLPCEQQTAPEAIDIAIANVPDYMKNLEG